MEPLLTTHPTIMPVLEDLKHREPIFHHPEGGTTAKDFEQMTDEAFWEVGASGRRYSREYVIKTLVERYQDPAYQDVWETKDFHCLEMAPDHFLLTYTLVQEARTTRRATIWRRTLGGWKILYHQGTPVEEYIK